MTTCKARESYVSLICFVISSGFGTFFGCRISRIWKSSKKKKILSSWHSTNTFQIKLSVPIKKKKKKKKVPELSVISKILDEELQKRPTKPSKNIGKVWNYPLELVEDILEIDKVVVDLVDDFLDEMEVDLRNDRRYHIRRWGSVGGGRGNKKGCLESFLKYVVSRGPYRTIYGKNSYLKFPFSSWFVDLNLIRKFYLDQIQKIGYGRDVRTHFNLGPSPGQSLWTSCPNSGGPRHWDAGQPRPQSLQNFEKFPVIFQKYRTWCILFISPLRKFLWVRHRAQWQKFQILYLHLN